MLKVKLLNPDAKLPVVAHPGEDLGYDIFASEDVVLLPHYATKVPTGIAVEFTRHGMGALIRDRSSMAAKNVFVTAGVLDWGYRGEISVVMTHLDGGFYNINKGDKIAQLVPIMSLTHSEVLQTDTLGESSRGTGGFGSTGK